MSRTKKTTGCCYSSPPYRKEAFPSYHNVSLRLLFKALCLYSLEKPEKKTPDTEPRILWQRWENEISTLKQGRKKNRPSRSFVWCVPVVARGTSL